MISAKVAFSLRREESRIANDRVIHRSFQVPVQACLHSAIVSAERDGYFGLRQSLSEVLGDATSSLFFQEISGH